VQLALQSAADRGSGLRMTGLAHGAEPPPALTPAAARAAVSLMRAWPKIMMLAIVACITLGLRPPATIATSA
jgi:hypothetical protein